MIDSSVKDEQWDKFLIKQPTASPSLLRMLRWSSIVLVHLDAHDHPGQTMPRSTIAARARRAAHFLVRLRRPSVAASLGSPRARWSAWG